MANKTSTSPTLTPEKTVQWESLFENPDMVGSSEYRALHVLLGDALEKSNPADFVAPETELNMEEIEHGISILDEVLGHATALRFKLEQAKKKLK